MLYILRRTTNLANGHPAYVARAGSEKSYTSSLARARVFQSKRAAESEKCGNEVIEKVSLSGQLNMGL